MTTAYPAVGSQQAAAVQKEVWNNDGKLSDRIVCYSAMEGKNRQIKYQILPEKEVVD